MLFFSPLEPAGYLPLMLEPRDPRSPQEQLNETYAYGGGWNSFSGFTLHDEGKGKAYLTYPGDPPMRETSRATFREKTIILFQSAWLAVVEADGSCDIARID